MKRELCKYLLLLLSLALGSVVALAENVRVTFEVNIPNRIIAGEPFQVQFILNDSGKDMRMDEPKGLDVLYGPAVSKASSISIINGKHTQSKSTTYTYTLLANSEGEYMIPSASVKVGSSTYKTSARKIKVFSAEAAGTTSTDTKPSNGERINISGKELYVAATVNKKTVYEQEPILVNFKLYSSRQPNDIPKIKLPEFDGFIKEEVDLGGMRQIDVENVNGKPYYTVNIYSVLLYPQKAGTLTIPEGSFDVYMLVRVNRPVESFFDSFRDQYQEINQTVKSRPLSINVKHLPEPKPKGFDGAVGQFKLNADIPDKVLKTNESFMMKLNLEGTGNLKLIQVPEPILPEGFEAYDPKMEEQINTTAQGSTGVKSKEVYAVPRYTGDFVIPQMDFVYFDPSDGNYKTITLPEVKLHVDKGKGDNTSTAVSGLLGREDVKYLGEDIRYLKPMNNPTKYKASNLFSLYLSLFLYVILCFAIFFVDIYREKNSTDTASNRSKKAGKKARKYLQLANRSCNGGESSVYYEALLRGLNNYLSDKFHIPLSELSKDNIATILPEMGVSKENTSEVLSILLILEMAQYTPMGEKSERDELYDRASDVIDHLEKVKLKKK